MKLSNRTIQILKSFSTINPSIMFEEGNVLSTISSGKTILAKAKISETFEKQFGVFELSRFLGVLSMFNDPELVLHDDYVKITDGKKSVNFIYAFEESMVLPPKKDIKLTDPYVEFTLTNDVLQNIMKGASILQLNTIAIEGTGHRMLCKAIDLSNPSNNSVEIDLQEESRKYRIVFSGNNLKLLPHDYKVKIAKGISHFVSDEVEYFIATEASSTYE